MADPVTPQPTSAVARWEEAKTSGRVLAHPKPDSPHGRVLAEMREAGDSLAQELLDNEVSVLRAYLQEAVSHWYIGASKEWRAGAGALLDRAVARE